MAFERRKAKPAAGRVRAEEEKEAFQEVQRAALITAWKQKRLRKPVVPGAGHALSDNNNVSQLHIMQDFHAFRRSAVRYWERRRIIYNAALILPALVGYGLTDTLNWVGDPHKTHYGYIIPLFLVSALGANICYSFSYALKFLFGSDDPTSRWLRSWRTAAFISGVLFAMLLALIGGWNIAIMEWNYGVKHIGRSLLTP